MIDNKAILTVMAAKFKTSASSVFPGWSRDFDCTYVHPNGLREHTIGYYSQPT